LRDAHPSAFQWGFGVGPVWRWKVDGEGAGGQSGYQVQEDLEQGELNLLVRLGHVQIARDYCAVLCCAVSTILQAPLLCKQQAIVGKFFFLERKEGY